MDRLHQLIEEQPDNAIAIIDTNEANFSSHDLRKFSDQLATLLTSHGLRSGDRLGLVAENCALYATVVMACSKLNVWTTLLNARQTNHEISAIANEARVRFLLFTKHVSKDAEKLARIHGAEEIGALPCGPVVVSPCRQTRCETVQADASDVAALIYTTGTSGFPKGVMLSHANIIFNALALAKANNMRSDDEVLAIIPGTHIYCFASIFMPAMAAGAKVRFMCRFDADQAISNLRSTVSIFPTVPQMFASIVEALEEREQKLSAQRLRIISMGGAPLDQSVKQRTEACFGLPLHNGYGLTETAPAVAVTSRDNPRADCGVGQPLEGVEIKIDIPNKDGVGEILVRGPNVMKGYYRNSALTAAVMTSDGYFRTGDLGWLDENGALFIAGRSKEVIVRSGFSIYPIEVEQALVEYPGVQQAAVIGRKIPGNEEVLAFIITHELIDTGHLQNWLRERLAPYKTPQHIYVTDSFPKAATGKILKNKLIEHCLPETNSSA